MKITLCGSARFETEYHEWNKKLTLAYHVVHGLSTYPSIENGSKDWHDNDHRKVILDLAHLAKIEESDAIFVINKNDYIGDSTRQEVCWARMRGKRVYWLEATDKANAGEAGAEELLA